MDNKLAISLLALDKKKNLDIFSSSGIGIDRNKIANEMWKNYGMTFIEYIFLKKFRNEHSHIKIKGEQVLKDIVESNKPVIFISGHFANFELMSMEITKKNIYMFIHLPLIQKNINLQVVLTSH